MCIHIIYALSIANAFAYNVYPFSPHSWKAIYKSRQINIIKQVFIMGMLGVFDRAGVQLLY